MPITNDIASQVQYTDAIKTDFDNKLSAPDSNTIQHDKRKVINGEAKYVSVKNVKVWKLPRVRSAKFGGGVFDEHDNAENVCAVTDR